MGRYPGSIVLSTELDGRSVHLVRETVRCFGSSFDWTKQLVLFPGLRLRTKTSTATSTRPRPWGVAKPPPPTRSPAPSRTPGQAFLHDTMSQSLNLHLQSPSRESYADALSTYSKGLYSNPHLQGSFESRDSPVLHASASIPGQHAVFFILCC